MGQRIVIVGSSFAGLTAALGIRKALDAEHEVVVVSKSATFQFLPSLIWVPFGLRRPEDISFELQPLFDAKGIRFVHAPATELRLKAREVVTPVETLRYDHLVLATGPQADWASTPGLGPNDGHTQSIWSLEDAQRAQVAWERFLLEPGPLVVGAAPGASNVSAAYEFLLNAALQLHRRGPQGWIEKTFVTPEPWLGHLGIGGLDVAGEKLQGLFHQYGIESITDARIERVTPGALHLSDGRTVKFAYALVAPRLVGSALARTRPDLTDDDGFFRVNAHLQTRFPEVFAAGSATSATLPGDDGIELPRTGYTAERMGRLVAKNVVAAIEGRPMEALTAADAKHRLILDAGDTGLVMGAERRDGEPERQEWLLAGAEAHWAKTALERWYLLSRSRGFGA